MVNLMVAVPRGGGMRLLNNVFLLPLPADLPRLVVLCASLVPPLVALCASLVPPLVVLCASLVPPLVVLCASLVPPLVVLCASLVPPLVGTTLAHSTTGAGDQTGNLHHEQWGPNLHTVSQAVGTKLAHSGTPPHYTFSARHPSRSSNYSLSPSSNHSPSSPCVTFRRFAAFFPALAASSRAFCRPPRPVFLLGLLSCLCFWGPTVYLVEKPCLGGSVGREQVTAVLQVVGNGSLCRFSLLGSR